jgi:hypothetical protein
MIPVETVLWIWGRGTERGAVEGMNSSRINLIHCRNLLKCHNVPPCMYQNNKGNLYAHTHSHTHTHTYIRQSSRIYVSIYPCVYTGLVEAPAIQVTRPAEGRKIRSSGSHGQHSEFKASLGTLWRTCHKSQKQM